MFKKDLYIFIDDILDSIEKIERYTKGVSFRSFLKDEKTFDAVIRNLEIIGEAVNKIPKDLQRKYNDIPWEEIIAMRNKLIHEYFGVDPEIVWRTIRDDLFLLKKEIKKLSKK